MAVQTRVKIAKLESPKYHGLDRDTLVRLPHHVSLAAP